ncbi:MAG: hypothetical protein HQM10_20215 [Candidatus Riflebacteria bacterium]|nr:hypothetical protein [Candidatus Riflebacteria bacterium]
MKKLSFVLALCLLGVPLFSQAPDAAPAAPAPAAVAPVAPAPAAPSVKYTIDEERYMTTFQKEKLPEVEKQIEAACGAKVPLEVDFASFAGDYESMKWIEGQYGTGVLITGLGMICKDDIGKKRFTATIKKIVMTNDKNAEKNVVKVENGTLIIVTHLSKFGADYSMIEEVLKGAI